MKGLKSQVLPECRQLSCVFLILAIALAAGCVGQYPAAAPSPQQPGGEISPPAAPGVKEFELTIFHTRYEPASFSVNKGDTVRILARTSPGTESHVHGVTIDEYNINQAVTSSTDPATIEFTADKAGTFTIYCRTCYDGPFGRGHPDIRATLSVAG